MKSDIVNFLAAVILAISFTKAFGAICSSSPNLSAKESRECSCETGYVKTVIVKGLVSCVRLNCTTNLCGVGSCYLTGESRSATYYCECPSAYVSARTNGVLTCVMRRRYYEDYKNGLLASVLPTPGAGAANQYFRHLSAGYTAQPGQPPAWNFSNAVNWASAGVLPPIKDQKTCKACSTFATLAAMQSLLALLAPSLPQVDLSAQQLLDCGADTCAGGTVTATLRYAASTPVAPSSVSPYTASASPSNCNQKLLKKGAYSISMYEQASLYGWLGLLLAVQQQPVIVAVQANANSFLTYTSGVLADSACFSAGLDHALLLVGYNLTGPEPFWLLQNSWGSQWGEGGFVRLAIRDGDGICGINVLAPYYPIMTSPGGPDPCNQRSLGGASSSLQGRLNPCGGGVCAPSGPSYTCACPPPFVAVVSVDGTQTCAPASPCSFYQRNPCGVGTCLDSDQAPGAYTCLCPLGYAPSTLASSNSATCAPAGALPTPATYTVPPQYNVSCTVVASAFGVSLSQLSKQNPKVDCALPALPAGTLLNVTNSLGPCSLPYSLNSGDTCSSVADLFSLRQAGLRALNPDLNCSRITPGQLVCVERRKGALSDSYLCTLPYTLQAGDSCQSIIATKLGGDAYTFFRSNPGIYCNNLSPSVPGLSIGFAQVCLKASSLGTIRAGCRKTYTVRSGDTCWRLIGVLYGSQAYFKSLNGVYCKSSFLYTGQVLCIG